MSDLILDVHDLKVSFDTHWGTWDAVRGVSFSLERGKTLAIVGESGAGKTLTGYALLKLIEKPGRITGQMLFHPRASTGTIDIARLPEDAKPLLDLRGGKIGMIFQEPMTALSPVHRVGDQLVEAIRLHRDHSRKKAWALGVELLRKVGLDDPDMRMRQFPFQMSGGQRQRVVMAIAVSCGPEILIADEPTTAVDVLVQEQLLKLLNDLKREMGISVIFITHDFGVVAQVADEIVVMNDGLIVESGPARDVLKQPFHPYTKRLLAAVPRLEPDAQALSRAQSAQCDLPAGYALSPPDSDYRSTAPRMLASAGDHRRVLVWKRPAEVPA